MNKEWRKNIPFSFFDSNCMIGQCDLFPIRTFVDGPDLLSFMDEAGIDKAVVYSSISMHNSPDKGNHVLMDQIKGCERLYPCAVAIPHHTGEFPAPGEFGKYIKDCNIKIVRIIPSFHSLSLDLFLWGGIFEMLEKSRIPLLLDLTLNHWSEKIDWTGISNIAAAFPGLPLIIIGMGMTDRYIYPMFNKFKNLYVETSYYQTHRGIEKIVREFGAERLIFGTGLPAGSPNSPMASILLGRLDDEERAMIAGGNLERLMGRVQYD